MKRRLVAVAFVATVAAVLGLSFILRQLIGGAFPFTWPLFMSVVLVSNAIWIAAAVVFARRHSSLMTALLFGGVSPLIGGVLTMGIYVVIKLFYFTVPIGIATAYVVWRIATSTWHGWYARA
jgi:hypothetical protein